MAKEANKTRGGGGKKEAGAKPKKEASAKDGAADDATNAKKPGKGGKGSKERGFVASGEEKREPKKDVPTAPRAAAAAAAGVVESEGTPATAGPVIAATGTDSGTDSGAVVDTAFAWSVTSPWVKVGVQESDLHRRPDDHDFATIIRSQYVAQCAEAGHTVAPGSVTVQPLLPTHAAVPPTMREFLASGGIFNIAVSGGHGASREDEVVDAIIERHVAALRREVRAARQGAPHG